VIKTACGVVGEKRFGGQGTPPNRWQCLWTALNIYLDDTGELPSDTFTEDEAKNVPDFYLYEQVKNSGLSYEELSKRLKIPVDEINRRISKHMELEILLNTVKDDLYKGLKEQENIIV
jgi:hypothetical protein